MRERKSAQELEKLSLLQSSGGSLLRRGYLRRKLKVICFSCVDLVEAELYTLPTDDKDRFNMRCPRCGGSLGYTMREQIFTDIVNEIRAIEKPEPEEGEDWL